MSEFHEVMRQWVRARKATTSSCEENVLSVYPLEMYDDALIADIEHNVMQWAAEHPEPVYPSWEEWLMSVGVISGVYPHGAIDALGNLKNSIPANIAEKLGLEPKEDV